MTRVLMVPIFVWVLLWGPMGDPVSRYIALALFAAAALTDLLDGYIARSRNLVTDFGKFMDPLADKLLVMGALVAFVELEYLSAWIVIIILGREFIISGFRLVAASKGVVIAAGWWGKTKTVIQMAMIVLLFFQVENSVLIWIQQIFIILSVVLSIISLIEYIYRNQDVLK